MRPGASEGPRWFAVQCLSNRETGAALQLANQNFEPFLPRRKKIRRQLRKLDTIFAPLFPGYLFVKLDLARDRWRSVNGTFGVASLVMQGDRPAPLPRGFVEELRGACDAQGVFSFGRDIRPGEAVRVLSGPLADFVGELECLDGPGRVRVLLDILGRATSVTLPRDQIIPADCFA